MMFLVFLADQIQQQVVFFNRALKKIGCKKCLWGAMKSLFATYSIETWQNFYDAIAYGHNHRVLKPNTS